MIANNKYGEMSFGDFSRASKRLSAQWEHIDYISAIVRTVFILRPIARGKFYRILHISSLVCQTALVELLRDKLVYIILVSSAFSSRFHSILENCASIFALGTLGFGNTRFGD